MKARADYEFALDRIDEASSLLERAERAGRQALQAPDHEEDERASLVASLLPHVADAMGLLVEIIEHAAHVPGALERARPALVHAWALQERVRAEQRVAVEAARVALVDAYAEWERMPSAARLQEAIAASVALDTAERWGESDRTRALRDMVAPEQRRAAVVAEVARWRRGVAS